MDRYPTPTHAHYLAAIDLGKTKVGWSLWYVAADRARRLVDAGTVKAPRGSPPEKVAALVHGAIYDANPSAGGVLHVYWVCEWPMKYPDKRKYHADLDSLYAVGNALKQLHGLWDATYTPGQWKGNVPKPAHHRRLHKNLAKYLLEVHPPHSHHDTWDAIGIGAYALGLTERGGVL